MYAPTVSGSPSGESQLNARVGNVIDEPELERRFRSVLGNPAASPDVAAYKQTLVARKASGRPEAGFQLLNSDAVTCTADAQRSVQSLTANTSLASLTQALLPLCDGRRTIGEMAEILHISPVTVRGQIQSELGRAFTTAAVQDLERQMPILELARWPTGAANMNREYWSNAIAVRKRLNAAGLRHDSATSFIEALRELQVTYLMGAELNSHYVPASETRSEYVRNPASGPGSLRLFSSEPYAVGPGGDMQMAYFGALCDSLEIRWSANAPLTDAEGVYWGEYRWSWEAGQAKHQFHPPVGVTRVHVERLHEAFVGAERMIAAAVAPKAIDAIARFLQMFVCLHPFPAGNMGYVMNIVNWMLRRLGGMYIPHLHIDWCAHRLEPDAFIRLFRRVVLSFGIGEGPPAGEPGLARRLSILHSALQQRGAFETAARGAPGDLPLEIKQALLLV